MLFDDDDGLDEEADFELQTRLFTSETGHLFAVLVAETFPFAPRPCCPRQSVKESARDDDMMMILVLINAAVLCGGFAVHDDVYPKS